MGLLDVVNDNDEVVGTMSREGIYHNLLPHRIIHVWVFNGKGEIALQVRAATVKFLPGYWDSSASGHVVSGETPQQAGQRELLEEVGITGQLEFLRKEHYIDHRKIPKIISLFKVLHEGPFKPDPKEVEKVVFLPVEEIKKKIQSGENLHPELVFLIQKEYGS